MNFNNKSSQWIMAYYFKKLEPILRFFCSLQLCTYVRITFGNITIKVILSLCAYNLTRVNCIGFWKNIRTAQGQIIFDGEMLIAKSQQDTSLNIVCGLINFTFHIL